MRASIEALFLAFQSEPFGALPGASRPVLAYARILLFLAKQKTREHLSPLVFLGLCKTYEWSYLARLEVSHEPAFAAVKVDKSPPATPLSDKLQLLQ